jgi:hypothetical protein
LAVVEVLVAIVAKVGQQAEVLAAVRHNHSAVVLVLLVKVMQVVVVHRQCLAVVVELVVWAKMLNRLPKVALAVAV